MLSILACDPGTNFGWMHSCGESGTWDLSVRKDESSGMRLIRLRSKLDELYTTIGFDLLVYEAVRMAFSKGRALIVAGEIQGTLKSWCEEKKQAGCNIEYRGYSSKEIKKFGTGNGNANKEMMVDAAERIVKSPLGDNEHDRADAIILLHLAKSEYCQEKM